MLSEEEPAWSNGLRTLGTLSRWRRFQADGLRMTGVAPSLLKRFSNASRAELALTDLHHLESYSEGSH